MGVCVPNRLVVMHACGCVCGVGGNTDVGCACELHVDTMYNVGKKLFLRL